MTDAAQQEAGALDEPLFWFLKVLEAAGGDVPAGEGYSIVGAFCDDRGDGDDTYNLSESAGYSRTMHSGWGDGQATVRITETGKSALRAAEALRTPARSGGEVTRCVHRVSDLARSIRKFGKGFGYGDLDVATLDADALDAILALIQAPLPGDLEGLCGRLEATKRSLWGNPADGEWQDVPVYDIGPEAAQALRALSADNAHLREQANHGVDYDAHDWWKSIVGDQYKPSGDGVSVKHLHPSTVKSVFDQHAGTAVADVICGLLFRMVITENREQFLTKYERERADKAEGRLSARKDTGAEG